MSTQIIGALGVAAGLAFAAQAPPTPQRNGPAALDLALRTRTHEAIERAVKYLVAAQGPDGGWEAFGQSNVGVSALVLKAIAQDDRHGPRHPAVTRGTEFLLRFVQPDGGIYAPDEGMRNYHTSVALMALVSLRDPERRQTIENAQRFLKQLQWDAGEGHEASSTWYGGQGYGRGKRPDLSNTQLMLEALHESGLPSDDPAYQKAMAFISRCQMLGSSNDQVFAAESVDGGFIYSPVDGGESKAGTVSVDGRTRLRSYGSMTYAGFKSMLYARVDRDDPRVKAAVDWIRRHYTLSHNPNMPDEQSLEGLYYYYHVFARALHAWGEDTIVDGNGVPHPWRAELCETLLARQRKDGTWVNAADRWYEGNPALVTAYAVLALQTALEKP
jgi:squalene-hopene/tetraprenyl-beta-curcumene cyclase